MDTSTPEQGMTAVAAGEFGAWLAQLQAMLRGDAGIEVPCGSCRGCCASSYYVLIRPDDRAARAVIPQRLLKPAPGMAGHHFMGQAESGACPMLCERHCTIYAQRPQTCRDYDCRVFAAAGIAAGGAERAEINERVHAWRFSYATAYEQRVHDAIRAAASFLREQGASFPEGRAPTSPGAIAVMAIKSHQVFLRPEALLQPAAATADAIICAAREFDARPAAPASSSGE